MKLQIDCRASKYFYCVIDSFIEVDLNSKDNAKSSNKCYLHRRILHKLI